MRRTVISAFTYFNVIQIKLESDEKPDTLLETYSEYPLNCYSHQITMKLLFDFKFQLQYMKKKRKAAFNSLSISLLRKQIHSVRDIYRGVFQTFLNI